MNTRTRLRNTIARFLGIPISQLKHYAVIGFRDDNNFTVVICCDNAIQMVNPAVYECQNGELSHTH